MVIGDRVPVGAGEVLGEQVAGEVAAGAGERGHGFPVVGDEALFFGVGVEEEDEEVATRSQGLGQRGEERVCVAAALMEVAGNDGVPGVGLEAFQEGVVQAPAAAGVLRSVKIGTARRVPASALVEFVARLAAEQAA